MTPQSPSLEYPDKKSNAEKERRAAFFDLFRSCPIPDTQLLSNLGLFFDRQYLSRALFMHHLYQQIVNVHGVVMELGVRWGQNLALFANFRGMYEPFNHTRKIIGFDTWSGFPSVSVTDGKDPALHIGAVGVTEGYEEYLDRVLQYHESMSPIPHVKKYELIKGDVVRTLPAYLSEHPETLVALAYFDLDLYEPTKASLMAIRDRLTRGSVLGFDELNADNFPGETVALREALGVSRYPIRRYPNSSMCSYIVIE